MTVTLAPIAVPRGAAANSAARRAGAPRRPIEALIRGSANPRRLLTLRVSADRAGDAARCEWKHRQHSRLSSCEPERVSKPGRDDMQIGGDVGNTNGRIEENAPLRATGAREHDGRADRRRGEGARVELLRTCCSGDSQDCHDQCQAPHRADEHFDGQSCLERRKHPSDHLQHGQPHRAHDRPGKQHRHQVQAHDGEQQTDEPALKRRIAQRKAREVQHDDDADRRDDGRNRERRENGAAHPSEIDGAQPGPRWRTGSAAR